MIDVWTNLPLTSTRTSLKLRMWADVRRKVRLSHSQSPPAPRHKKDAQKPAASEVVVVGLREISDFGIIVIVIIAIGRLLERWENEKPWEGTNLLFISFYSITFVQRIAFLSRRVQNRNLIEFACKTDFRSIELEKMFRFSWLICSFILVFFVFFSLSLFFCQTIDGKRLLRGSVRLPGNDGVEKVLFLSCPILSCSADPK